MENADDLNGVLALGGVAGGVVGFGDPAMGDSVVLSAGESLSVVFSSDMVGLGKLDSVEATAKFDEMLEYLRQFRTMFHTLRIMTTK